MTQGAELKMRIIRWFRNLSLVIYLCFAMAMGMFTLATYAFNMSVKVAALSSQVAQTAVRQRKAVQTAVARTRAKARLRRGMVAIPVAGTVIALAFEEREYREWQEENPGLTIGDYGCEVSQNTAAVVDEVLQELPATIRPSPEMVMGWSPACNDDEADP